MPRWSPDAVSPNRLGSWELVRWAEPGAAPPGFRSEPSHNCRLCLFMALSWPNLPCALKAAIGFGKRTLGHPRQSAAPQGPQQRLLRVREPISNTRATSAGASPAAIFADGLQEPCLRLLV
jgi:hypothetical protein